MFDTTDPRASLPQSTIGDPDAVAEPQVFELGESEPDLLAGPGPRQWSARGATFSVTYVAFRASEALSWVDACDESILVLTDPDLRVDVHTADEHIELTEPCVVILPPGEHSVSATTSGQLLRVTAVRGPEAGVRNDHFYRKPQPRIDKLPGAPAHGRVQPIAVHSLAAVRREAGRFGRIFRSNALMVNLLEPEAGPRDPDKLSPHSHDTFEQCSVTLQGDYVHHLRVPWSPRSSRWRADEHRVCSSPSITIIPPGMIHTTGAIGDGDHLMVDVFAPPRADFLAMSGWVLNAGDYA